jgi:PAS domain S-box-containing protein
MAVLGCKRVKGSRSIVVGAFLCAAAKLALIPQGNGQFASYLTSVTDLVLSLLTLVAAWRASRRSSPFPRVLWLCVGVVASLWTIQFGVSVYLIAYGTFKVLPSAPLPSLFITSFPFAVALMLPLLLSEDQEKLEISWPQTLDVAQLAIVAFLAFLLFFYLPFLRASSDVERGRFLIGLHLTRDGFLALGYLYRGWRSRFPDLRNLHFRIAGFLAAYGIAPLLVVRGLTAWHWPEAIAGFVHDVPALFLLVTAATWQPDRSASRPLQTSSGAKRTLWTQVLPLAMPVFVVALASRVPSQQPRVVWIMVAASLGVYVGRLFWMQRRQNQTLTSLRALEEKFSKAFKSSPVAITISRLTDGRLIDVNDRALELMSLKRDDAVGKTSMELGFFEKPEDRESLGKALREKRSVQGMHFNFRSAGRDVKTIVSAEVIELQGEPLVITSMLDVTELKNVTEQLHHSQKMELVGRLAGGVAHDFNNLLTIITGHAALALTMDLNVELAEHVGQIKEASGKAGKLTRQLLALSRRQILEPRNISLNAVVGSIEELLRRTIGENIELVTSYAPDLGTVFADPAQMEQVVMNLAMNARDAMPQGGKLFFETKNLDLSLPYPEKRFEIPPGRYVMLSVTDTGTGIRPEDLDRIFEPFFTTKAVGAGTGLGLSTVYGIVKRSRGLIWANSELGKGTIVDVCLPRVDSQPDAVQSTGTEAEDLKGKETILVVDDDLRVCSLTASILGLYGYQVLSANSAEEASRRVHEFQGEINLLITDVAMPYMTGPVLAQALKEKRPWLKTLYMSGYPHVTSGAEGSVDCDGPFLSKPFTPIELARVVRTALRRY